MVFPLAEKVMREFIDTPVPFLNSILPRPASSMAEFNSERQSRRQRFFQSTVTLTFSRSARVLVAAGVSLSAAEAGITIHKAPITTLAHGRMIRLQAEVVNALEPLFCTR